MLSFTGGVNVFLALESVDLRQGFEGLTALVTQRRVKTCARVHSLSLVIGAITG